MAFMLCQDCTGTKKTRRWKLWMLIIQVKCFRGVGLNLSFDVLVIQELIVLFWYTFCFLFVKFYCDLFGYIESLNEKN